MSFDQELVDKYLARALEEFESNPLSAQLIRRLSKEFPGAFVQSALGFLQSDRQSGAHRYLALVLVRSEGIVDQLTNPAFGSVPCAVTLFKRLLAVDPMFDMDLARQIRDLSRSKTHVWNAVRAARALDILQQTSHSRRLVPVLMHLVAGSSEVDPKIAAKASLFVGRVLQNPAWVARQLKCQENPRVRANALESIWGLETSTARSLFEDWAHDQCNRVAGNALLALHIAGTKGIAGELMNMALSPDNWFRSTAAWGMGRIGDGECVASLNSLIRDGNPQVRSAALRSLIFIRRSPRPSLWTSPTLSSD